MERVKRKQRICRLLIMKVGLRAAVLVRWNQAHLFNHDDGSDQRDLHVITQSRRAARDQSRSSSETSTLSLSNHASNPIKMASRGENPSR